MASSILRWYLLPLVCAAAFAGCGLLSPDNPADPLWGVWMGPYPRVLSTEPDSARWLFTSDNLYIFYALKADGTLLGREVGYYYASGIALRLQGDPTGQDVRAELTYHANADSLTLVIRGETYRYRRVGDAAAADRFDDVSRPARLQGAPGG